MGTKFYVISHYSNGDEILEAIMLTEESAKMVADSILSVCETQDEIPVITIERKTVGY